MKTKFIYLLALMGVLVISSLLCQEAKASGEYDWLYSIKPAIKMCSPVVGAIGMNAVYVNMYCPQHDENGGMIQVQESLFIDLQNKTWRKLHGWYELF